MNDKNKKFVKSGRLRIAVVLAALLMAAMGGCGEAESSQTSSMTEAYRSEVSRSAAESSEKTESEDAPGEEISEESEVPGEPSERVSETESKVPNLQPFGKNGAIINNVPYINQLEDYPNGCEFVSAVMLLKYYDVDISVDEFIDNYLSIDTPPYYDEDAEIMVGGDPQKSYLGDPRSDWAWGCDAPPISSAMEQAAPDAHIEEIYDKTLDDICKEYIDEGDPVLIWATIGMEAPSISEVWLTFDGNEREWVYPNHALVLTGYDDEYYYFNDPLEAAETAYPKADVEAAYIGNGMQAIVIKN